MTLAKAADGSQAMIIRLHPADLGTVQVRIAHVVTGGTQIEIIAEKPTTLLAFQKDQSQLHRTLDEAGIQTTGRVVTFHVSPPTRASESNASAQSGGSAGHHAAANQSNSADGSTGGGKGNSPSRKPVSYTNRDRASNSPTKVAATAASIHSYHVGLDITA
jgi:flagellar hook-length control protein FliK